MPASLLLTPESSQECPPLPSTTELLHDSAQLVSTLSKHEGKCPVHNTASAKRHIEDGDEIPLPAKHYCSGSIGKIEEDAVADGV